MRFITYLASDYAFLDSSVYTGGGRDDTEALQALLDRAGEETGVRLVMDGAARVSQLTLSSNTTIECMNADCGFFQTAGSDCAILTNRVWDMGRRETRNITLIGGTYNQNCAHQAHDTPYTKQLIDPVPDGRPEKGEADRHWVFGLEFYGVENLTLRDLRMRDFRTFAVTVGGFKHMTIENVWLDLPGRMQAQNQDGFHFWGPGQFLTIRNVGGTVGDDFMNIGPDEHDGASSITDVLIDGVYLEHADQALRLLSRGTGTLDRVTIRNVTGTYRSFGFYINSWFPGATYGDFKNIFIENVDLRQEEPNYDYRPPMLFSCGGNIESLTIKNLRHHAPSDNRTLVELGLPFLDTNWVLPKDNLPKMRSVVIEGLSVYEKDERAADTDYIQVYAPVDNLVIRDAVIDRGGLRRSGTLLAFRQTGRVKRLMMNNVFADGLEQLIGDESRVDSLVSSAVTSE